MKRVLSLSVLLCVLSLPALGGDIQGPPCSQNCGSSLTASTGSTLLLTFQLILGI